MIYMDNERITKIEKGYRDMLAGRTVFAEKVFADIRKDYGLEGHHANEKR